MEWSMNEINLWMNSRGRPPFASFDSLIHKFINSSNNAHSSFQSQINSTPLICLKRRGGRYSRSINNHQFPSINFVLLIDWWIDWFVDCAAAPQTTLFSISSTQRSWWNWEKSCWLLRWPGHQSFTNKSKLISLISLYWFIDWFHQCRRRLQFSLFLHSAHSQRAEMERNKGIEWRAALSWLPFQHFKINFIIIPFIFQCSYYSQLSIYCYNTWFHPSISFFKWNWLRWNLIFSFYFNNLMR